MPPVVKLSDQNELVPVAKYPYAKFPFEFFNPVQSRVFEYYDKETSAIIAANMSAGKAQPDDSLVLTPTGYARLDQIKVGDYVIGGDGKPTLVVGVYPQGLKPVYDVCFDDCTSTQCCDEHLWVVTNPCWKNTKKNCWQTVSLAWLRDRMSKTKEKWRIPMTRPVVFPERDFEIHPYVLGLIIGDGGIGYCTKISNKDEDILERFRSLLPLDMDIKKIVSAPSYNNCDYTIFNTARPHFNTIARHLDEMNLLGRQAHEKFIPHIYKHSSIEQRIELLRGLLDSDGCRGGRSSAEFGTSSVELAEDVAFLIRSLGGRTRVRKKEKVYYKYKGVRKQGRPCYRLTVSLGGIVPFFCARKRNDWVLYTKRFSRNISAIKESGIKSCRCIKVENSDGLYLTNDFIVTHNTITSELMLGYEIRKRGGKGMYLAPLRALAQEKIDDWTDKNHSFSDLKISICTGDYRLTAKRQQELEEADLIIMTSEMLSHRVRNHKSEKSKFLQKVGTLVVDEFHGIASLGRGDHVEAGLMKFTELNPKARLVLLSGTMPNVDEIADWVSYVLTQRDTFLLKSSYRPCPLNVHFEKYYDGENSYDDNEAQKIASAMQIVEYYPDDKFLIFAHTKKTGELMKKALQQAKIPCDFHNADLAKDKRVDLEQRFKNDPKLRVIIATSTLAQGLNLPARRVIILGVHRGMGEVMPSDILQAAGRAGRPAYDPVGDSYILLPEKTFDMHKERLRKPSPIVSQLLENVGGKYKTLAFHLVSEIHQENIKDKDDVHHWYKRSLAAFQSQELDDEVVDKTIDLLKKCGAIWEEGGKYTATSVGKVSSMFYFSPFDAADLKRNFNLLFDSNKEHNDLCVAVALGNVDTHRGGIVSRAEREDMFRFSQNVAEEFGHGVIFEPAIKAAFAYNLLLNGKSSSHFAGFVRGLQFDFQRVCQVLQALDGFTGKWGRRHWFEQLGMRVTYGVSGNLVQLCLIDDVGKVRATKLWDAGLKTIDQVANDVNAVKRALNCKDDLAKNICKSAKILSLTTT